jgi:PhzF family phenazine biosynthesis protein
MKDNIFLVNCFCSNQENSGNPAAIVTNFTGNDSHRLALANKLSLPVTVFISDLALNEPIIKFFYPDVKMPLCLHGTLAAAEILIGNKNQKSIIFSTDEGKKLYVSKSDNGYLQVEVASQEIESHEINKEILCRMLNLTTCETILDNLPLCISSVGSPKLLIPLDSLSSLSKLQPDYDLIRKWSIENNVNGIYVYTDETYHDSSNFHARGFNPKTGHKEDAATGVAAAALSLALKRNIQVEQGYFMGKPCSIIVTYTNHKRILVGGKILSY